MNTKHYILLMAATLMMVGCAFDDPMEKQKPWVENDSELPKPVNFSVSTANSVDFTRAAESIVTFNKDEQIRVLVKPMGSEAYTSYDYTTADKGQNVALTAPDPQPYFPAGIHTTVNAYAYYPATASIGSSVAFTVADYQRDSADYKASDLMMAENRIITKDVDDGKNKLTMKHLMAQLRVKAVPDSASDLQIKRILVEAKRSLFFTPEGETIATTTGENGTITVLNEIDLAGSKGGEGYILIPPQAISGVTIKVVTGTEQPREIATYNFSSDGVFQAGASYGVDITVTPDQLGFTTAIANWNGMGSVLIAPSGDLIIDPIDAQPYGYGKPVTLTTEETFDGTKTIPAQLRVRKGSKELTAGVHYSVQYMNNIKVGTAYVVVMGLKSDLDSTDVNYFDYTNSCGVAPFKITSAIATISYGDVTEVVATYGDEAFITPIFNGGDGEVTYTSDDESIATVNAITGQVTLVKPGTTTIRARVADGANFIYSDNARTASYTLKVNKAAGSIKFDEKTPSKAWNADESKNFFTQSVTHVGSGTVTYTVPATTSADNTCGATIDGSTVHFTQAGQVVVTATVVDNDYYTYDVENHTATATYTLTVTKALGFVNLSVYSGSVPYDKTAVLFTIGAGQTHGGTLTVASNDPTIATAIIDANNVHVTGVKAGTTKIVVTCAATAQYQEAKAEFTVTVGKVAITGVTAPTAKDLTYTGSAQALVNTGSADFGQMQYRLGTNQAWSDNVPELTNAGTYQVYWQVLGDNNHSTYTPQEPVVVTIAKAAPTYTAPTAIDLTYNGSAQAVVTAGNTSHGTIQFSTNGTSGWSTSVPTETNAGTYTVYWRLVGDDNHNSVDATQVSNVAIAKAAPTYGTPSLITGLTYNGSPQTLVNDVTVTNGTISYSTDDGANWPNTPKGTNAGTYTVYYKVDGNENYSSVGKTLLGTVTIAKKTIATSDITLASQVLTYNGTSQTRNVSTVAGLAASSNNVSNWSVTGGNTGTNAGSYTLTVEMASTCQNYTGKATASWTIAPKPLTSSQFKFASTSDIIKEYVWEIGTYTNALTNTVGCDVEYTSSNTGVATVSSTGVLTPKGTLSTYTTITATATGNYSGSTSYRIKANSNSYEFTYTGAVQEFTVGPGTYLMECWGAQGGKGLKHGTKDGPGGKGGYAKGTIKLSESKKFYIYVGGQGADGVVKSNVSGGWNGGGKGCHDNNDDESGGGGGGATDIRLTGGTWNTFSSLKDRIMVAGGGGGGAWVNSGGDGGGTSGTVGGSTNSSYLSTAATQTTGYKFGVGQDGYRYTSNTDQGGGGGGYYGAKARTTGSAAHDVCGSGGSGFVSGMEGCDAITSGSTESSIKHSGNPDHYSGYKFTDASMQNGVQTGNGKAKITWTGN